MANVAATTKFGIKEVADVTFTSLDSGNKTLTFDTLKVSNLEFTAEEAFARGGKGTFKYPDAFQNGLLTTKPQEQDVSLCLLRL